METSCIKSSTALPFWQLSLADLAPGIPNLRLPELPKDLCISCCISTVSTMSIHFHPFPLWFQDWMTAFILTSYFRASRHCTNGGQSLAKMRYCSCDDRFMYPFWPKKWVLKGVCCNMPGARFSSSASSARTSLARIFQRIDLQFKGKSKKNHRYYQKMWGLPVEVPFIQFIG